MKLRRQLPAILLAGIMISCTPVETYHNTQRNKLNQLNLGITKQGLLAIMGTGDIQTDVGTIPQPYKVEITRDPIDSVSIEVVYYYTDIKQRDGVISDDELTPFFIKNGKLIGWGWSFFGDLKIEKRQITIR